MRNLFSKQRELKNQLISKLKDEINTISLDSKLKRKNFILIHLYQEGSIVYLPEKFELQAFYDQLSSWFLNDKKTSVEISDFDNVRVYQYKPTKGLRASLGLSGLFQLMITQFENQLIFDIKPAIWFDEPEKNDLKTQISKFIQDSYEPEIHKFIENTVFFKVVSNKYLIQTNNRYIENIKEKEKIWFHSCQQNNEILLCYLSISTIKKFPKEDVAEKELEWKFILTTDNAWLVGFSVHSEVEYIEDLSNKTMNVKNELGRNPVIMGEYEWLTKLMNDNLFKDIEKTVELDSMSRIRDIAALNWKNRKKDRNNKNFALFMLDEILRKEPNSFDEFTRLFIEYFDEENEKLLSTFNTEKLNSILRNIITQEKSEYLLSEWVEKWGVSHLDAAILVEIFMNIAESSFLKEKLLPFHRTVKELFYKESSDKVNTIVFGIGYCKHLLACNINGEAATEIELLLKQLPDETISDILPSNNLSPTSQASGQLLKVTLIDLLAEASGKGKSISQAQHAAQLQPLVKQRIDTLAAIATAGLKERAEAVKLLCEINQIIPTEQVIEYEKIKPLDEKIVNEHIKHQLGKKENVVEKLQKAIAKINTPDYSIIKSYSEPVNELRNPELYKLLSEIKTALNLLDVETYIARGDKSVGIRSFDGEPSFLIIGGEHLDKTTPYYLTHSELRFAIAVEMAHLYFKHARITSSDVWRGAVEKGNWVLDGMMFIFPVIGLLGKAVHGISKLNTVAKVAENAEKIAKITSKSKNVVTVTEQATEVYKKVTKQDSKTEKQQELLATSRVMQLTADRTGIIFCGDIKSAVRSMFLTKKDFAQDLDIANQQGILEFLNQQNPDGTYKHFELAIRISNLISFYISQEYELIRKDYF